MQCHELFSRIAEEPLYFKVNRFSEGLVDIRDEAGEEMTGETETRTRVLFMAG